MIIMRMNDAYLDTMFKAIELGKILAFYRACRAKGTLESKHDVPSGRALTSQQEFAI